MPEVENLIKLNTVIQGDCFHVMKNIPDKSIDMILCDLPYGTTACSWDIIIPFEPLWDAYKRIIKDNGAIVLTASQPFTSKLVMSNLEMFKYELIWDKVQGKNFLLASIMPLKSHENILIFCKSRTKFNPQMRKGFTYTRKRTKRSISEHYNVVKKLSYYNKSTRHPISILKFNNPNFKGMHPTQKPVALFEYLIKTYTNKGDTVLDNCAGSGTTAIACIRTNRNYILIEKEKKYVDIAQKRINKELKKGRIF